MHTLENAIRTNDYEKMVELLTVDPPCIDVLTSDNIPMSFLAARLGNEKIFRYIVEYSRASFNVFDKNHRSVLHYAVESGCLSLVSYIVERVGVSPLCGDYELITPFDLAVDYQKSDIIEYFTHYLGCTYNEMYRNPILTGMHPDPSILRVGTDYYMVNSSFIFFPCIPISHSTDLIHWEVIGHAITNPDWAYLDELEGGRGYWAPDISYHKGRFYITATYRLNDTGTIYRKQMVVSSDKPEGPYCKPAFLDEDGIDPSIFTDDDGKRYMLLNRGARIFEISEDGTKQLSEATLLYYGDHKRAPEGPHLLKKDGFYYLFEAEGGTGLGHRITVSRSATLFGIYEPCPYNPIMREWEDTAPLVRCGHGKPVCTQYGEWFMVYLCARLINQKYTILGRETALDPITWTKDGWPIVNRLQGPSILQKRPNLPLSFNASSSSHKKIPWTQSKEWVTPRPPEANGITLNENWLILKGSKASLSTMFARNIYLKRQNKFKFCFSATMSHPELSINQNAGLTCYYDENTYLTFGLIRKEQGLKLQVMEHIDSDDRIAFMIALNPQNFEHIQLRIDTSYLARSFSYAIDSDAFTTLGTLENVFYLCDEGIQKGKRFTGAMYGIYAYAGEQPLAAEFTDFMD